MKLMTLLVVAVAGAVFLTHGQGAAQSTPTSQMKKDEEIPPIPTATGSPQIPDVSQLDEVFKQNSVGKAGDALRQHVEWRKLENQVANDPAVLASKRAAQAARTDLEKRKRLSDYYNLYYKRMEALADTPDMKAALDGFKAAHLGMLVQPRVRPTPTPSPTVTPVASPATRSLPPAVHIEPPLPSAAPSATSAAPAPATNPAILPTPIPSAGTLPSPSVAPSPTATETP